MLQSQKIKCLVLSSKYVHSDPPTVHDGVMETLSTIDVAQDIGVAF